MSMKMSKFLIEKLDFTFFLFVMFYKDHKIIIF